MLSVTWSGRWPNLCSGEWRIMVDDVDYSSIIPEDQRTSPMGTYKTYTYWHFSEDWEDIWADLTSGLKFPDWVKENPWVNKIPALAQDIYNAIQENDWDYGTCGGCI